MNDRDKDRIECAIRHIQSSLDVDPWAMNIAVEAMKKQLEIVRCKPEWIPCSERLPAYGEDVILSIGEYCNVGYLVAVNDETNGEWHYSGWYHPMNDVSAWMPLPEPYKAESEDK